jgi:hypothetical protein
MISDCWSEEDYQFVLKNVKRYLGLYVQASATIEELKNVVTYLTKLENKEIDYLSTVHFLLSEEVKVFVDTVPKILRRFSHSTQKENITHKGFVKGRIDWNMTIKERCANGYDQTIFVCRPTSRIYNLPENQLLKFVLVQIRRLIDETAVLPPIEEKNISLAELRTEDGKEKWTDRLSWLKYNVNNALTNIHLREVDIPDQVNERMIRRAQTARNKDYELAADSYSVHQKLIQEIDKQALKEIIEKRVLEPLERDSLYELYVLFEVMDSLGEPKEINLIRPKAESIGTYEVEGETVRVYFQKASGVLEESEYTQIFEDYDIDVSLRRPDIVLKFEKRNRLLIIEVKRTRDADYIIDSVYKVLGYLADFHNHFPPEQKPKGLLVVWNIKRIRKTSQDIAIIGHDEIRNFVQEAAKTI